MKKQGFTLAEVLITLTIIGVIAAMSIPTLLSKYQKHTYVVGLKKANSEVQNVFQMLPLALNCPAGDLDCAGWTEASSNTIDNYTFERTVHKRIYLLAKLFKNAQFKTDNSEKTFTDYYYYDIQRQRKNNRTEDEKFGFVTEDGMTFTTMGYIYIVVDVNGKKEPNTFGRDMFIFTVEDDSCQISGRGEPVERLKELCPNDVFQSCGARVLAEDKMDY